jgi:hypothetical protein
LDTTFDSDGKLVLTVPGISGATANAMVLQPEGKIVLAGSVTATSATTTDFGLFRINP